MGVDDNGVRRHEDHTVSWRLVALGDGRNDVEVECDLVVRAAKCRERDAPPTAAYGPMDMAKKQMPDGIEITDDPIEGIRFAENEIIDRRKR